MALYRSPSHVIHSIANRDAVLKVMVTLTCPQGHLLVIENTPTSPKHCQVNKLFCTKGHMTFALGVTVRTNIPSKFEGPSPKHCQVIKCFSTKGPINLDLCPQDHLLVRTNISTKFEGHKHCRIVSFFGTKGHGDIDLWLKGHLLFRSILPISLIVLGLLTANDFLLYVEIKWPHLPHLLVGPLFIPGA